VLLRELGRRGYKCIGVEVDKKTARWTAEKTGLDIRCGVFPDMDLPSGDVFLCFDVLEHSLDPVKFLRRAAQILLAGRVAIIQSPIEYEKRSPLFAEMCAKTFDDSQHVFIFSRKGRHLLAAMTGFEVLAEDSWRVGHEIAVLREVNTT
jgi:2-polyprenyl-3-methyl-5-hydroxy-6-metoxy-1,4-benzoquinol methylase